MVERHLAKVDVAGSNPVSRSIYKTKKPPEMAAFFVLKEDFSLKLVPDQSDFEQK